MILYALPQTQYYVYNVYNIMHITLDDLLYFCLLSAFSVYHSWGGGGEKRGGEAYTAS